MRYSELTGDDRCALDDPATYPRYVRFLGKEALLGYEELRFLRDHGIDFEIGPEEAQQDEREGLFARLARALRRRKKD
jgi:hypothetical protein